MGMVQKRKYRIWFQENSTLIFLRSFLNSIIFGATTLYFAESNLNDWFPKFSMTYYSLTVGFYKLPYYLFCVVNKQVSNNFHTNT